MHQYWAYGLMVESEMAFPELLPYEFEKADITIQVGKTPKELIGDNIFHKVSVSMSPNEYLLKLLNIANYYVANGNKIIVEPLQDSNEKDVRLFTLSNAFAAILYQRNLIPLHASGIFYKDGVALFCGKSGAGKSTLITALQQKGYKVFTDDVCVLQPQSDGTIKVIASYPMIKLWEDSFFKIGITDWDKNNQIRDHLPKYAYYYHKQFVTVPQKVVQLFVLDNNHQNDLVVQVKRLTALDAFDIVEKNTYRHLQMIMMKKRNVHFKQLAQLVNSLPVFKCNRPAHQNTIDNMITTIENNFV